MFSISSGEQSYWITAGSDDALWFSEQAANRIGRITTGGTITEFGVPTAGGQPYSMVGAADGNVWFTETRTSRLGRVTPTGVITEFPLPNSDPALEGIVALAGSIYFGGSAGLWRATAGIISPVVSLPAGSVIRNLTVGPQGTIWYTSAATNKVGRFDPVGRTATEYTIPTPASRVAPPPGNSRPDGIALGSDGAIWFTESDDNEIGRIDTNGAITEFTIPTPDSVPSVIVAADGALWFSESGAARLARITTSGTISEFQMPPGVGAVGITTGPDGNLWIAGGRAIARFRLR